ncbi:YcaO-like family protein [Lentzea chajnantorensis]
MITYTPADPPAVRADGALTLVGPTSGVCTACAEHARLTVAGAPPHGDLRLAGLVPPAFRPFVEAVGQLEPGTLLALRTDLALVSTHRVRPRPGCCPLPEPRDTTEITGNALRADNPLTTVENLTAAVVDHRFGPVTGLFRAGHLPLPTMTAELHGHGAGHGRTAGFEQAERVALFEAVERYNGMRPRSHRTTFEASFAELGPDHAVDPATLGLPDHHRYTPNLTFRWVEGWSYTRQRTIAVPEQVAYWDVETPPEQRFLHETSNGCGLGNSLTEAVLHGLFEVAERDAFLMAWYAQTPLRRIRLPRDPLLHHLTDRLEELGYELLFLDATTDIGIPSVLALARTDRTTLPRAFFAAGASPDPTAALRSAAVEVVVDVESFADRARANPGAYDRHRLLRLLHEPELVRSMDDHVAVNTLPEAADRYAFLVGTGETVLEDHRDHTSLEGLLDHYSARLRHQGLELVAVDQTDPVTAGGLGLHSAKVLVPGALPMTFGHRRTAGLPRLRAKALHPHPFP